MTNKAARCVVLLTGGAVASILLLRYLALSRAGLPVDWMLYLGLPVTAAGVLFALLLANVGEEWTRAAALQPGRTTQRRDPAEDRPSWSCSNAQIAYMATTHEPARVHRDRS